MAELPLKTPDAQPSLAPLDPNSAQRTDASGSAFGAPPPSNILYPTLPPTLPFQPQSRTGLSGKRLALLLVAIIAFGGATFALLRRPHVATAKVERGVAIDAVYATGTIEAEERVTVKSKTSGSIELLVKEGAKVRKGDLLARVDSARLRAELVGKRADQWAAAEHAGPNAPELASLDAEARALEADLRNASADRDRMAKLVSTGAAPQPELDRLFSRISVLEARRDSNQATRRSLQIDLTARVSGSSAALHSLQAVLADTEVHAPIDGVVLSRSVEAGETVTVNQPLFKLGDTDRLILECNVDESDIGKVTVGNAVAVTLYAFASTVFSGTVIEILPEADRLKKTFLTKVRLSDPPEGLRSGMSGEANIVFDQHKDALLVPSDAIDESGQVALVKAGRLERVPLTIGIRDMLHAEVLSGVSEGDEVIVSGGAAEDNHTRVNAEPRKEQKGGAHATPARGGVTL